MSIEFIEPGTQGISGSGPASFSFVHSEAYGVIVVSAINLSEGQTLDLSFGDTANMQSHYNLIQGDIFMSPATATSDSSQVLIINGEGEFDISLELQEAPPMQPVDLTTLNTATLITNGPNYNFILHDENGAVYEEGKWFMVMLPDDGPTSVTLLDALVNDNDASLHYTAKWSNATLQSTHKTFDYTDFEHPSWIFIHTQGLEDPPVSITVRRVGGLISTLYPGISDINAESQDTAYFNLTLGVEHTLTYPAFYLTNMDGDVSLDVKWPPNRAGESPIIYKELGSEVIVPIGLNSLIYPELVIDGDSGFTASLHLVDLSGREYQLLHLADSLNVQASHTDASTYLFRNGTTPVQQPAVLYNVTYDYETMDGAVTRVNTSFTNLDLRSVVLTSNSGLFSLPTDSLNVTIDQDNQPLLITAGTDGEFDVSMDVYLIRTIDDGGSSGSSGGSGSTADIVLAGPEYLRLITNNMCVANEGHWITSGLMDDNLEQLQTDNGAVRIKIKDPVYGSYAAALQSGLMAPTFKNSITASPQGIWNIVKTKTVVTVHNTSLAQGHPTNPFESYGKKIMITGKATTDGETKLHLGAIHDGVTIPTNRYIVCPSGEFFIDAVFHDLKASSYLFLNSGSSNFTDLTIVAYIY
jgi:hypothetical protein